MAKTPKPAAPQQQGTTQKPEEQMTGSAPSQPQQGQVIRDWASI
jgi:hypothetical protein